MTTDEFKAKLDSTVSKSDLEALTNENKEIKGQLAQVLEALNKAGRREEPKVEVPEEVTDPLVASLTDPEKFIQGKLKPVQDAQTETQAQVMEMRARQNPQFAGVFAQYGDELTQLASKMPASTRAGVNFWEWHIRTVLGDKFVRGELKSTSYPTLIGSSSVGPNADGGDPKDPNKGFKPEVAGFLKDRGVDLDQAAKLQRLMDDGEPITLAAVKGAARA